jgi:NAD-dependent DNA ligase
VLRRLEICCQWIKISREKVEEFIRGKCGIVTSAVSGKTNYLIVGYKLEDGRDIS